jgi:predicted amidophosphoribosyltransferase
VVTCPRCGASRGDSDRFCADCGAPLGRCPSCGEPTSQAIAGLRRHSSSYHLAHGLLDHAEHLLRSDDNEAAEAAIAEARDIAERDAFGEAVLGQVVVGRQQNGGF